MYAFCLTASLLGVSMQSGWGVEKNTWGDGNIPEYTADDLKKEYKSIIFFSTDKQLDDLKLRTHHPYFMPEDPHIDNSCSIEYDLTKKQEKKTYFQKNGTLIFEIDSKTYFCKPIRNYYFLNLFLYNSKVYHLIADPSERQARLGFHCIKITRDNLAKVFDIPEPNITIGDRIIPIGISFASLLTIAFLIACYIVNKKVTPEQIKQLSQPLAWLTDTMKNIDAKLGNKRVLSCVLIGLALVIINGGAWGLNEYRLIR